MHKIQQKMAEEDIKELKKELKKLKPRDRIKKLKELGKIRKGEINEIENLIKASEKELKTETVAEEITPEQTEVDIGRLFEEETTELEATVKKDAPPTEGTNQGYMSLQRADEDYTTLKDITYASMMGPITPAQSNEVDQIGERLDRSKYQTASQEVANILVASRAVLYKIKKYAGTDRPGDQFF